MPTELQGGLVLNEISEDGGSTWKIIVCEDTSQISGTSAANETQTKCGTFTAVENNAVQVTGSGVAGGDLASNQVSYLRLQQLRDAKTKIKFRRQNSASGTITAGEITYALFDAYVTEATETAAEGEVIQFNWAVTSTGTIDWNPNS
jgi:hypothetical protein